MALEGGGGGGLELFWMTDEAVEPTENWESREHEPRDQEGAPLLLHALTPGWLRSTGPGT